MKIQGDIITHARFVAESSRIVRKVSKWIAHETLRMHAGEYSATDLVDQYDIDTFVNEIIVILGRLRKK